WCCSWSAGRRLVAPHLRKQRREVDLERTGARHGLPGDSILQDFRTLVIRPPAFDEPRVQIDNPVSGNTRALVAPSLELAIGSCTGWRQHFDYQYDRGDVPPVAKMLAVSGQIDEEVGLEHLVFA